MQGPHPRGQQLLTLHPPCRHWGSSGGPPRIGRNLVKVSLAGREGGAEDTSGSPLYQGLELKTGMMLLAYTYWYYTDFFKGGSCRDVPVTDTRGQPRAAGWSSQLQAFEGGTLGTGLEEEEGTFERT